MFFLLNFNQGQKAWPNQIDLRHEINSLLKLYDGNNRSKVGGAADIDGSGVGDYWPLQHMNKLFVRTTVAYNTMVATGASPWNQTDASGSEMRTKRRSLGQRMYHKLPPRDLLEHINCLLLHLELLQFKANIRKKMTKEERKAIIKVGTEDNVKYQSKDVVKQKKTGGLRNKQKKHKKAMLDAAKRSKIERSKYQKFHESVCPLNDTKCILQDLRPLFTKLPHKSLPNLLLISNEIRTTRAGGHGKNNFLEVLMLLKLKRNSEIWDFEHGMRSGDEGQDLISELNGGTTSTVCIGESSLKRFSNNITQVPGDLLKQYQDIHGGTFVVTGNYLRE
ncbi:hypothetical protein Tco_1319055 [Tanacetum coccineum]